MIQENTSPATPTGPDTQDQLTDAAITVIAAWRNGCGSRSKEVLQLQPRYFPDACAHALWFSIRHYEAYPRDSSYENILAYARHETNATEQHWQDFWKRVEGARADADDQAMRKAAQLLIDGFAQQEQQRLAADMKAWEERDAERAREKQERLEWERQNPPAFTREDVKHIVWHDQDPPRDDVDPLPPPANHGDRAESDEASARHLGKAAKRPRSAAEGVPKAEGVHLPPVNVFPRPQDRGAIPRFTILPWSEVSKPVQVIRWLVEGILAPGSVSIFFGKSGSKKTYALLWMAVCKAAGRDWLGFKTRPGPVLVVDEESGRDRLHRRLQEIKNGAGITGDIPLFWMPPCKFKLTEEEDVLALRAHLLALGIELVIVDSLAATSSGDENKKEFAQIPMDNARRLAQETTAHFAIIHHTPKSESNDDTPRGSSVFEAAPDLLVQVRSPSPLSPYVEFRMRKTRDARPQEWAARCAWTEDPQDPNRNAFTMERAQVRSREEGQGAVTSEQYVIQYLRKHGESTRAEIMDNAEGCSPKSASNAIYSLRDKGKIRRTNPGAAGQGVDGKYELVGETEQNPDDLEETEDHDL